MGQAIGANGEGTSCAGCFVRDARRPYEVAENARWAFAQVTYYVDEIDPNYRALRERIIELAKAGHKVERWELRAPRDGFRFATVYVKDGPPLTWHQPWSAA